MGIRTLQEGAIIMSMIVEKNKAAIREIEKELPKLHINNLSGSSLSRRIPNGIVEEATDIVSNYINEAEWGTVVKVAIDRAINYYEREKVQARELVRTQTTDSEYYQWMVGSGFSAAFNASGAAKRTVMFDLSSRYARIFKAGLAVEFTDEMREAMTINLMNETLGKVADAFDELETDVILNALSSGVANGTTYFGVKHSSHILDAGAAGYGSQKLDHEKMLDMMYILENEGYQGSTMVMPLDMYYQLLQLDVFKDAQGKWTSAASPRAVQIIEGDSPGKPILPGMSMTKLVVSPLFPAGEVVMFDPNEYLDFVIRKPLGSEAAPHDALREVSTVAFSTRYGVAAREPTAAVKMTNLDAISLANKFA